MATPTVEEYLVQEAKALLLEQDLRPDTYVESSGVVKKMTREDQGYRQGMIWAYLDAILAVRAGHGLFADERHLLRTELLVEARQEVEGRT